VKLGPAHTQYEFRFSRALLQVGFEVPSARMGFDREFPRIKSTKLGQISLRYLSKSHFEWKRYVALQGTFKGALCAYVIRLQVSYNQDDETLSQNLLSYLSKADLPIG